ncbi:MAG: hypothetical protein PVF27_02915 [Gemmatimonadales bacterium]|jgi:hypothetical protein
MPSPPPCTGLGRQCREVAVTLRVADLDDDSQTLQDAAATWILGHTERITMGKPYVKDAELLVDAVVHVPCKHLRLPGDQPLPASPNGVAEAAPKDRSDVWCAAHGFRGRLPRSSLGHDGYNRNGFRRGDGKFRVVFKGRQRVLELPLKRAARRALPVVETDNPCWDAPCRTADNTMGAACCRDLTLDVVVPKANRRLEALLRARRPPYLCKVTRTDATTVECEVISACGYLAEDGVHCVLHDRLLPNGRPAKPSICFEWPDLDPDDAGHPGCALL